MGGMGGVDPEDLGCAEVLIAQAKWAIMGIWVGWITSTGTGFGHYLDLVLSFWPASGVFVIALGGIAICDDDIGRGPRLQQFLCGGG